MDPLQPFQNKLESMERHNLLRELSTLQSAQTPVVQKNGRDLICLASNNYLGLTDDPSVKNAAKQAIDEFGTGSGAARLITGNFSVHEQLENKISTFKNTDSAIVFGSGYAANVGTIQALAGSGTVIYSDEYNHASIVDGIRLSGAEHHMYSHNDPEDLERLLETTGNDAVRRMIITDGLFSMDGDVAPLPELVRLSKAYDALLMVDDAHGTGVLGEDGRGSINHFGLTQEEVPVQMGTLSKALASSGGFVTGPETLTAYLRNRARSFVYSTAPTPPVMAAARRAIDQAEAASGRRETLKKHIHHLHSSLTDAGLKTLPDDPAGAIMGIQVGGPEDTLEFSRRLEENGLLIPAVRPPTVPRGQSRLRLTVMATHQDKQIERAVDTITSIA